MVMRMNAHWRTSQREKKHGFWITIDLSCHYLLVLALLVSTVALVSCILKSTGVPAMGDVFQKTAMVWHGAWGA